MKKFLLSAFVLALTGCATKPPYDYTNYKVADPKSILVLPPKNSSPDIKATNSFYSHVTRPLAEAGYYVLPVTLVDETFKNNGLTTVDEIHLVDQGKLRNIFGADAALYIEVKDYGTRYFVVGSAAIVTATGKLIDLKSGNKLWEGQATASSEENNNNNQAGLAGLLITALVKQIVGTVVEQSHPIAGITSNRLLSPVMPNGILYGPRSPLYKSKQ